MEKIINKNKESKINKTKIPVAIIIFFIASVIFAIPSIIYLVKNKTIYGFYYVWTYFFKFPENQTEMLNNALIFFLIMTILFLAYIMIAKKHKKINAKKIFIMVILASVIFGVIIPYTSTDVYSYIANGWSSAHYRENPYYTST